MSATVAHRPTPRGGLMVAHETGHALHALVARGADTPGVLVGETVACWASLVTGLSLPSSLDTALALGDTLVEELFVSAAVSAFEDDVYLLAAQDEVSVANLNEAWLRSQRMLWGSAVEVPDHVGSGWARLPSLATDPGHAFSYAWATLLALAIGASNEHTRPALAAGGIDADHFTTMLGFVETEWIDRGCDQLSVTLTRLIQVVESSA